MFTAAKPDAVMAAVGHLIREWGEYGYSITALDSPTIGGARISVRHADGSEFTITADRWGNIAEPNGADIVRA